MKCDNCNAPLKSENSFCTNCGKQVETNGVNLKLEQNTTSTQQFQNQQNGQVPQFVAYSPEQQLPQNIKDQQTGFQSQFEYPSQNVSYVQPSQPTEVATQKSKIKPFVVILIALIVLIGAFTTVGYLLFRPDIKITFDTAKKYMFSSEAKAFSNIGESIDQSITEISDKADAYTSKYDFNFSDNNGEELVKGNIGGSFSKKEKSFDSQLNLIFDGDQKQEINIKSDGKNILFDIVSNTLGIEVGSYFMEMPDISDSDLSGKNIFEDILSDQDVKYLKDIYLKKTIYDNIDADKFVKTREPLDDKTYTCITFTADEQTILKVLHALGNQLKNDEVLKDIISKVYAKIGESSIASVLTTNIDNSQIMEEINSLSDALLKITVEDLTKEKMNFTYKVYYDRDESIIKRVLNTADDEIVIDTNVSENNIDISLSVNKELIITFKYNVSNTKNKSTETSTGNMLIEIPAANIKYLATFDVQRNENGIGIPIGKVTAQISIGQEVAMFEINTISHEKGTETSISLDVGEQKIIGNIIGNTVIEKDFKPVEVDINGAKSIDNLLPNFVY